MYHILKQSKQQLKPSNNKRVDRVHISSKIDQVKCELIEALIEQLYQYYFPKILEDGTLHSFYWIEQKNK